MSRFGNLGARLYRGEASYDFIGKRNIWYAVSGVLLAVSIGSLLFLRLDAGIEFEGGAVFTASAPDATVEQARAAVEDADVEATGPPTVTKLANGTVRIQTLALTPDESALIIDSLVSELDIEPTAIQRQLIGPSWGGEITKKAVTGLIFFLVLVAAYLAMTFEWKMALAAIIALLHDVIITAGLYALIGFEVTPATVIGLLTILGYSLYDTVVVFDKVRENTRGILGSNRWTYSQAANLAVNQTVVRSINTSVVALLPVLGLLVGGVFLIGAGALNDLALVLFIGMAVGAYSSIFIATPIMVQLKEAEPPIKAQKVRVEARQALVRASAVGASPGQIGLAAELPGRGGTGVGVPVTRKVVVSGARTQPKKASRERRTAPPKKRR